MLGRIGVQFAVVIAQLVRVLAAVQPPAELAAVLRLDGAVAVGVARAGRRRDDDGDGFERGLANV